MTHARILSDLRKIRLLVEALAATFAAPAKSPTKKRQHHALLSANQLGMVRYPRSLGQIVKSAKRPRAQVKKSLLALRDAKKVKMVGNRRSAKWVLS